MSHQLVSLSPDLKKLRDEGYDIAVKSNHLLVIGVPYVNAQKQVKYGTLVSELTIAGEVTSKPATHVAFFIGDHPCNKDGVEIAQIRHTSGNQDLGNGLVVNHSFSNKPADGYANYYDKMTRYIDILMHQALAIDSTAKAKHFSPVPVEESQSVFKYLDTASSRAGIMAVAAKLAIGKIAIVGVGGTGSYVLDMVAKTQVKEIHLFDGGMLLNHNAFRAPGAPSLEQLSSKPLKVEYFAEIYSRMRHGIVPHTFHIEVATIEQLKEMAFVFLCIDKGESKRLIVEQLIEWRIPFIDVGIGIELVDGQLGGILRVTTSTPEKHDHLAARISYGEATDEDYASNIQIADLNALNATLAVVRWKKLFGFYRDLDKEYNSTYTTDCHMLHGEDNL